MKKTVYRVTLSSEGQWVVKKEGGVRATSVHSKKADAISRAIILVKSSGGDTVNVHTKGKRTVYRSATSGKLVAISDSEVPPRRPPPRK